MRLLSYLVLILLSGSCSSYNKQAASYYGNLRTGNYEKAARSLDNNKLLAKSRNRLLFVLEKGKLFHLMQQWDRSNTYFNEADQLMEDAKTSAKDIALGTLINPMMKTYQAEDFEKYLVHYYKALNYLQLNQHDEAIVEARRISLRSYTQEDKTTNKNKYSEDAFSLMIQGLIYEASHDINNAFIAYRNAADVFISNKGSYYDIQMPEQLKKDILRLADENGFADELGRYEGLLNVKFKKEESPEGGELIVFWENGAAPVKAQQDIWFSLFKNAGGGFFFTDAAGTYNVPFDLSSGYNSDNIKLENLRSFRVALPKYEAQPLTYSDATIQANGRSFSLEAAENINTLAFATLKQRMLRELSSSLTRLAIKKLAEAAIRSGEVKDDGKKTEEQRKKDQKERAQREAIALGVQIFNFATEKADTRNWQSLPHTIYYVRVPLQKGPNTISLQMNGAVKSTQLSVTGNGGIQFQNICTLR